MRSLHLELVFVIADTEFLERRYENRHEGCCQGWGGGSGYQLAAVERLKRNLK